MGKAGNVFSKCSIHYSAVTQLNSVYISQVNLPLKSAYLLYTALTNISKRLPGIKLVKKPQIHFTFKSLIKATVFLFFNHYSTVFIVLKFNQFFRKKKLLNSTHR
ncbi:hypothetical protein FKM82_001031 [Ascaphus truei]